MMMALALWFAGLIGLVIATAAASGRARAAPNEVVGRGVIMVAGVAYAVLVLAAVWTWGGTMAASGRADRLRDGASVHLTLRGMRMAFDHAISIGHGRDADLRLPGAGPGRLAEIELAAATSASPNARVRAASPDAVVAVVSAGADPAGAATVRGCVPDHEAFALPPSGTIVVIECADGKPQRAVMVRRDPSHPQLVVAPMTWRGRFLPVGITVTAGDVLRVGAADDAVPGVRTWDPIALRGSTSMLAVPSDPTACTAWAPQGGSVRATPDGCELVAGAFEVVALPMVPDATAVIARAARAAFVIGAPPLALLIALALRRRRGRRADALSRALRLCVLGAGLTALVCWRLLWAYRIDMMRELAAIGPRLLEHQLAAIAIGAAIAGNAAFALHHHPGRATFQRALVAVGAWAVWLVLAWVIVDLGVPEPSTVNAGVLGLSVIAAVTPLATELSGRWVTRLGSDGPELALGAIAIGAVLARHGAPRSALLKLALAYFTVLAGHAALRTAVGRDAGLLRRARGLLALLAAAVAMASLDAGVTLAIAGTGLALAMIVAGHDALYDASQVDRLGVLEREHARLLRVHGAAAILLAIGVGTAAVIASDRALVEHGASAVLHAPLVIAGLFGLAAVVARSHRRAWVPWLAAALAALTVWGARDGVLQRATTGEGVAARRVSALVEPGYALLRDERAFAANVSAWREAAVTPAAKIDPWAGQGYFGALIRDPGVGRSIDNDYLPVLIVREGGIGGLTQGIVLLLVLIVGAGALASVRLRHASRGHRTRWLVTAVAGSIAVYQPLAALGVLPLTGISWPGLGIDSPADLWLFVIGSVWCVMAGDSDLADDERVRGAPRLARARRVVIGALALTGVASVVVVARSGAVALGRDTAADARVDAALQYAGSIQCAWPERSGATPADVVPTFVAGTPTDRGTIRFDLELRSRWLDERARLLAALPEVTEATCRGHAGRWHLDPGGDGCVATLRAGWPEIQLTLTADADGVHGTCSVSRDLEMIAALRRPNPTTRAPRLRVVSVAMGAASGDVGELVAGNRIVRLRPGAPPIELAAVSGLQPSRQVTLAAGVTLEVGAQARGAVLRGPAELFVATEGDAWHRLDDATELVLDRLTLIVAGSPDHRVIALFRPPRTWAGVTAVDPLLADDTTRVGDRARRAYPYGAALAELGWVNPFDVDHSLGLDGWIHAAQARPASSPVACGTLAPPAVPRDRVCSPSPLDGVTECRVTLQPELSLSLRRIIDDMIARPAPHTGRDVSPVRAAYVAIRGDTGELLAQGNVVPGRPALAYAPEAPEAEAELVRLREAHGESDRERVEWNLPIAVGSTLKPIVARAAEQAFPRDIERLWLSASGHVPGCKARRGVAVDPILGHCPPTSLAGQPPAADLHDFLARSPNWYQAALGLIGLGLPDARLSAGETEVSLADLASSDLASWPTDAPLRISDATGKILDEHGVSVAGLRRTPLWSRIERLLGRPVCTLGSRAPCERAAARADVCAARGLPIATPSADLRYLVSLGPDRIDPYGDDRPGQSSVPVREYLQLLRGSGVHGIGSLAQLTDAFGRVIYDPDAHTLAASWFPSPIAGIVPTWSCASTTGHTATVLGADGGLCGVLRDGGTASKTAGPLLADPTILVYGAKTGTIDSLADIARRPAACNAWNARHGKTSQLTCGATPPDDSLFVIAFGVVTPNGTIPITLGIQLQRAGTGAAARLAPELVHEIAKYLR